MRRNTVAAAIAAAGAFALLRRARAESLRGEAAIVTGASRGLGFALARELLREGCRVVVCARDEAELRGAAEELAKLGEIIPVVCDLSKKEDVERLVATAMSYFGRVDILVNNAGVIEVGPAESMELADFERMMGTMFWGMAYASLAVLPAMKKQRHGRIVNITSIGGKMSIPHLLPYSAAKFAAVGFSEGLHAEMTKDGIHVTTVVPGLMRTGSYRRANFKGDVKREYGWFAVASSMPGLAMNANRAARQIVRAMKRRSRESILSAPAKLGVRAHGVAPGTVTGLLALIARMLPRDASRREVEGRDAERRIHSRAFRAATFFGRRGGDELRENR
jgi:short-subunit dehydrogenase